LVGIVGTFSCVFHAESLIDGTQVAIKRIYPTYSPSRIVNEIRMLIAAGYGGVALVPHHTHVPSATACLLTGCFLFVSVALPFDSLVARTTSVGFLGVCAIKIIPR
jgi:hypothetical protein